MHNPLSFCFSHICALAPGMESDHGAAASMPWGPPLLRWLTWHTPHLLGHHIPYSFIRKPNPTQERMASGDYGNVRGNKAKTKNRRKHRHQGLTVVQFVPLVGDEDGRKGVITGEVDLRRAWQGWLENLWWSSSLWLRDDEMRCRASIGRLWSSRWKEFEGDGRWVVNRASELVVLALQPWRARPLDRHRRGELPSGSKESRGLGEHDKDDVTWGSRYGGWKRAAAWSMACSASEP
jgi:hypothetical protein